MKKILVIAAHPDDEVLGCGGTLAKYSKKGSKVKDGFEYSSGSNQVFLDKNEIKKFGLI